MELNPGTVQFKFEVDGEWKCSNDYDTALDGQGNLVNYLRVEKEEDDIMEILSSAVSSVSFGGVASWLNSLFVHCNLHQFYSILIDSILF